MKHQQKSFLVLHWITILTLNHTSNTFEENAIHFCFFWWELSAFLTLKPEYFFSMLTFSHISTTVSQSGVILLTNNWTNFLSSRNELLE